MSKETNISNSEFKKKNKSEDLTKEETSKYDDKSTLDPKDKRIYELELALFQAQKNERDNVLRAKAEIENFRRRSEIYIEQIHKFALEKFCSELLPVIDNLERFLENYDKSNVLLSSRIEGIELTLKLLLDVFLKFGIKVVKEKNVLFNPEIHQAIKTLKSDEYKPNHVILVMQKGYTLNGRLIRPAMVVVSKEKK